MYASRMVAYETRGMCSELEYLKLTMARRTVKMMVTRVLKSSGRAIKAVKHALVRRNIIST